MTEAQYWDGDCTLTRSYREADRLRQERQNSEAWLQGMYVYDALLRASPILHAFAKKGAKPRPYPEEPYTIGPKDGKEAKASQEKKAMSKGLVYMQTFMESFNQKFKDKERK